MKLPLLSNSKQGFFLASGVFSDFLPTWFDSVFYQWRLFHSSLEICYLNKDEDDRIMCYVPIPGEDKLDKPPSYWGLYPPHVWRTDKCVNSCTLSKECSSLMKFTCGTYMSWKACPTWLCVPVGAETSNRGGCLTDEENAMEMQVQ